MIALPQNACHRHCGTKIVRRRCSRNPDFAHPVLKIIQNCSLILGNYFCRIRGSVSTRGLAIIPAEFLVVSYGLGGGRPRDHEQSGGYLRVGAHSSGRSWGDPLPTVTETARLLPPADDRWRPELLRNVIADLGRERE